MPVSRPPVRSATWNMVLEFRVLRRIHPDTGRCGTIRTVTILRLFGPGEMN
jgi:hypothetical protein